MTEIQNRLAQKSDHASIMSSALLVLFVTSYFAYFSIMFSLITSPMCRAFLSLLSNSLVLLAKYSRSAYLPHCSHRPRPVSLPLRFVRTMCPCIICLSVRQSLKHPFQEMQPVVTTPSCSNYVLLYLQLASRKHPHIVCKEFSVTSSITFERGNLNEAGL